MRLHLPAQAANWMSTSVDQMSVGSSDEPVGAAALVADCVTLAQIDESVLEAPVPRSTGSYSQILKSSSIIGGAQAVNVLVSMVRTKGVALLLGPVGVGEVALFTTATNLIAAVSGLGIGTSGVRAVAEAVGAGDSHSVSRTIVVMRRIVWLTGLAGWLLMAGLAVLLSGWMFGTSSQAVPLAILGSTIFLGQLGIGQAAILQGVRRIGDLAKQSVIGAVLSTAVSLALYTWIGQRGIVIVLIAGTAINLIVAWWFARRVPVEPISITWAETFREGRRLVTLGTAFMYSGLVMTATPWAIQAIVARQFGTAANGNYSAAWNLSGQFAFFVLGAMAADFYPRLTAASADHRKVNRLVNEQTEIGILLALPGLLATLAFAPWVIYVFYSTEFMAAAEMLPWLVIGVFGRVVSWPMGFIQLALGKGWVFAATETLGAICHIGLVALLVAVGGLNGAAWALPSLYALYVGLMLIVSKRLTGFRWTAEVHDLLWQSALLIGVTFITVRSLPPMWGTTLAALIALVAGIMCVRGLTNRLGPSHRITRLASFVPLLSRRRW